MSIGHPSEIHDYFTNAVNQHDAEAVLAMYDPAGVAVQLDGSKVTGREAILAMCEGLVGALRQIKGTTRTLFVSGVLALTSGDWIAEIVLPDGSVTTAQGTTAEVSRRQPDGTWLVVIDDPMFS